MFISSYVKTGMFAVVLAGTCAGAALAQDPKYQSCAQDYGNAEQNAIRDEVCQGDAGQAFCANVYTSDSMAPHDHINNMARWEMYVGEFAGTFYSTLLREAAANPTGPAFAWAQACAGALPPGPEVEY